MKPNQPTNISFLPLLDCFSLIFTAGYIVKDEGPQVSSGLHDYSKYPN